jgi:hypothetical protein
LNGALAPVPQSAAPRESDPPLEAYGDKKELFEDKYKYVREKNTFEDGVMPEIAPQHFWVAWGPQEERFEAK